MENVAAKRGLGVFTTAILFASATIIARLPAQTVTNPPAGGITSYEVATKEAKISYAAIFQMTAANVKEGAVSIDCPANKVALGGGAGVIDPSNAVLVESKPSLRNGKAYGWFARFAGSNGPGSTTVSISAICAAAR
ncbi:MAG: hypothetical protein ACLPM3_13405 [Terracidiphilus sp.]